MTRLAIAGAAGRMGRCVLDLAVKTADLEIVCGLVAPSCSEVGQVLIVGSRRIPLTDKLDSECDVLLDLSVPLGTIAWLNFCEHRDIPMVIGVTSHSENQLTRIREAAHQIPIVFAANFSVGLNAILDILQPLVRQLGGEYDVEIVETHHRNKVDAPSGTALEIVDELSRARKHEEAIEPKVVLGRHGKVGPRISGEIGVHAVRMGDVVGQHEIHFSGPGETISVKHTAHSRDAFAAGALRAVQWIVQQGAGLYTMREVLAIPPLPDPGPESPNPRFELPTKQSHDCKGADSICEHPSFCSMLSGFPA
jgi:4-hydroxy-tetrahydrodipicolinate reductase